MQFVEYKCSRCGKSFIAAPPPDGKLIACVNCRSLKVYRLATQFGAIEALDDETTGKTRQEDEHAA